MSLAVPIRQDLRKGLIASLSLVSRAYDLPSSEKARIFFVAESVRAKQHDPAVLLTDIEES
jgi:hypothetical protein